MPTPSKFTQARRTRILELLSAGASRRTAAAAVGIDHQTLSRWLARGKSASEGSRWARFLLNVEAAEAHPRLRVLQAIHDAIPDNPLLAWKFVERREPGYASSTAVDPGELSDPTGPLVIQLTFGRPPLDRLELQGDDEDGDDG